MNYKTILLAVVFAVATISTVAGECDSAKMTTCKTTYIEEATTAVVDIGKQCTAAKKVLTCLNAAGCVSKKIQDRINEQADKFVCGNAIKDCNFGAATICGQTYINSAQTAVIDLKKQCSHVSTMFSCLQTAQCVSSEAKDELIDNLYKYFCGVTVLPTCNMNEVPKCSQGITTAALQADLDINKQCRLAKDQMSCFQNAKCISQKNTDLIKKGFNKFLCVDDSADDSADADGTNTGTGLHTQYTWSVIGSIGVYIIMKFTN